MDILIPLADFVESSAAFTDADLKKQVYNISRAMNALHYVSHEPLRDDPMVKMWAGHEVMLCEYGITLAEEYISRETPKDNKADIHEDLSNLEWHMDNATSGDFSMDKPAWWGDNRVHDSHKAVLLRQNYKHYSQHFMVNEADLPRYYPES